MKTIVAMFDNLSDAQDAVQDLVNTGIARDDISLVANDQEGRYSSALQRDMDDDDNNGAAAGGAVTGAAVGGIGGVLLGLGALAIPGIGPVIAAGPLVAGLIGAGVGAAVGGLVGALIDAGVPEEQAGYYVEGVRRGGTLLTVGAPESRVDEVVRILNQYEPVNIDERASTWRQSGWTGFDANGDTTSYGDHTGSMATTSPTMQTTQQRTTGQVADDTDDGQKIEVIEEDLRVGKRAVDSGGVRVQTHVTEKPVEEQVRLVKRKLGLSADPSTDRPRVLISTVCVTKQSKFLPPRKKPLSTSSRAWWKKCSFAKMHANAQKPCAIRFAGPMWMSNNLTQRAERQRMATALLTTCSAPITKRVMPTAVIPMSSMSQPIAMAIRSPMMSVIAAGTGTQLKPTPAPIGPRTIRTARGRISKMQYATAGNGSATQ